MNIDVYCEKLDSHLTSIAATEERVAASADILGKAFRVKSDEVAFFLLDEEKDILHFNWPKQMQAIGFIPLSSHDSLAAKTVRDNQPFLSNRFSSVHHASIFEKVRSGSGSGKPMPIQRIMSVPIPGENRPKGVIQISRKSESPEEPEDFSQTDLKHLAAIANILSKHF